MGTYRYKRILFQLRNAPDIFQRTLDIVPSGVRYKASLVYLYAAIFFSPCFGAHVEHFENIFHYQMLRMLY